MSDRITYTVTTYSNGDRQLIVSGDRLALEDLVDKIAELNAELEAERVAEDLAEAAADEEPASDGWAEWEGEAMMAQYDDDPNPYHGDYSEC